jgi:hypothetical protein
MTHIPGSKPVNVDALKANARLIAAAPDLLAALKAVNSWYSSDGDAEELLQALGLAEQAIAKAEGEVLK